MKDSIIITLILLFVASAQAQIYIAGDTTGKYVYYPEYAFDDTSAYATIDCDNSFDIIISSHAGGHFQYDWPTLKFLLYNNVEAIHLGTSAMSLFHKGDTIHLTDNIWFAYGLIWGWGGNGPYGWGQIDTEYIALRKIITGDTAYIFFKISTLSTWINIHQIISECPLNPLEETSAIGDIADESEVSVYPNPMSTQLTFKLLNNDKATIILFDILSRPILQQTFTHSTTINTEQLADGVYFYALINLKGTIKNGEVIKH